MEKIYQKGDFMNEKEVLEKIKARYGMRLDEQGYYIGFNRYKCITVKTTEAMYYTYLVVCFNGVFLSSNNSKNNKSNKNNNKIAEFFVLTPDKQLIGVEFTFKSKQTSHYFEKCCLNFFFKNDENNFSSYAFFNGQPRYRNYTTKKLITSEEYLRLMRRFFLGVEKK